MSLIEIFFFFFFLPPGRRRWQNLFHGKFQFLFPIWKTNGIISLRKKEKKKSFQRWLVLRGRLRGASTPPRGSSSHLGNGPARMDFALEWIRH